MLLVMFFLGMACGIILSVGVTIVWYDDKEDIENFFKDDNNG